MMKNYRRKFCTQTGLARYAREFTSEIAAREFLKEYLIREKKVSARAALVLTAADY